MENNNKKEEEQKNNKSLLILVFTGFIVAIIVGLLYFNLSKNSIYVENSSIEADLIDLSSASGGVLQTVFVKAGDEVKAHQTVAQVGNSLVKTKVGGIILSINDGLGKNFAPNEAVAEMIQPDELKVIAQIEEDKGLNEIKVGQRVTFTVDAFGTKEFSGLVEEISPTSRSGDVVFNISTARQEKEFNIKIRFSVTEYPELKNGMSAKVWIFKD